MQVGPQPRIIRVASGYPRQKRVAVGEVVRAHDGTPLSSIRARKDDLIVRTELVLETDIADI